MTIKKILELNLQPINLEAVFIILQFQMQKKRFNPWCLGFGITSSSSGNALMSC